MKRLSSTKEKVKTGIFGFFNCFSKIWKMKEWYEVERIGERADPCPTLTSTLKKEEEKLF